MYTYNNFIGIVNEELDKLRFGNDPKQLYDPIYYSINVGGKRIRPVLCLMSAELFGGDFQNAMSAAIGIEIFHNFTLLHDDMMDNALVRRGKPVVHVKWNNNIALLSGDAMSVIAYKYISGTKNHLQEILDVFSDTALKICEGQQFDMDFENAKNVSEDEYLKMINLKTAVLLAASLKIGAITANANAKDCENIYEFGRNLGMAFQLQDDLLDVFGDTEKFGKKIGGDIVANKKTYLLIKALELADEKTKEDLNYWLMAKEFVCDEKIVAVKTIYESLNIGEFSAKLMNAYFQTAFECFDSISLPLEKKEQLLSFTNKLRNREF